MGRSGDGDDITDGDIDYQHNEGTLCVHASGIADPESGIRQIVWEAGTKKSMQFYY